MRSDSMILYPTLFQSFTIYFREREREGRLGCRFSKEGLLCWINY